MGGNVSLYLVGKAAVAAPKCTPPRGAFTAAVAAVTRRPLCSHVTVLLPTSVVCGNAFVLSRSEMLAARHQDVSTTERVEGKEG